MTTFIGDDTETVVSHDKEEGDFTEAYGLTGNDSIGSFHPGSVMLDGGSGNDYLYFTTDGGALETNGTMYGGDGSDHLSGGEGYGFDILYGGDDDDLIRAGSLDVASTFSDEVYGGFGDDALYGGGGNDLIYGGGGSEIGGGVAGLFGNYASPPRGLYGGLGDDLLSGDAGNDRLNGGEGNDSLYGGAGLDDLDGGLGNDVMAGGAGMDTYTIDSAGDRVVEGEGEGIDFVFASVSYALSALSEIEVFRSTALNLTLTGSQSDNTIWGDAGLNVLSGMGGTDILLGLDGNDVLFGGDGNDIGGDVGLYGGAGTDLLDGGAGADHLAGGIGNDTFIVDNAADRVAEDPGEGIDTVRTSANLTLAVTTEIEFLLSAGLNLALVGSDTANAITGDKGANRIIGGGGSDLIAGGLGKDTLTGGLGMDAFVFNTKPNKSTNVDRITDFSVKDDTIRLDNAMFKAAGKDGELKSAAFWKGLKAHDASDRVIYDQKSGAVYYDADGTGSAAQVRIATLNKSLKVTYHDFLVI